jgi:hypothetical protein
MGKYRKGNTLKEKFIDLLLNDEIITWLFKKRMVTTL